ncbi:MarR family winged helix-turn-helix transcriptional regulator [Sphingobium scionense]
MNRTELQRALAHNMPQIARLWRQLADSTLAEFGVSNSAGWCLLYLDRLGADVRQIELADVLGITQPSLVRTLDHLQAAALIERTPNPEDRRSNCLSLTTSGATLSTASKRGSATCATTCSMVCQRRISRPPSIC